MKYRKIYQFFLVSGLISIFIFSTAMKINSTQILRSQPKVLDESDADQMVNRLGFHDEYLNKHGDFKNKFEVETISGEKVIKDLASGLMWQAKSSGKFVSFGSAESLINQLNNKNYAGCNDWRLPTLEEAMTLMEKKKNANGLFLDPLFGFIVAIWTSDRAKGSYNRITEAWIVELRDGYCTRMDEIYEQGEILAVRSISDKQTLPNKDGKIRSQSTKLSLDDVKNLLKKYKFYDSNFNPAAPGFANDFDFKFKGSFHFIIDKNSGLMWMPVPFPIPESCLEAAETSRMAKEKGLEGIFGWRMPTLEEAMTLMENQKNKNGLFISEYFNEKTKQIWTSDKAGKEYSYWIVDFKNGCCQISDGYKYDKYQNNDLLLVRSLGY